MTTLGARLRALRQQSGLTQRSLAEGLVTKSMISQIESDKVRPSLDLLSALALRLGVTVEQLLPTKLQDQERLARYRQAQAFLSLSHYEEALPLLQQCLHSPLPSWSLAELTYQTAYCLQQLHNQKEARIFYQDAIRLARKENLVSEVIRAHFRLGEIALSYKQRNLALQEWKFAYQEFKSLPPEDESFFGREMAANLCLQLANTYRELNWYQEAVHYYQEAFAWTKSKQLRKQVEIARGLAEAYGKLLDDKKAEEWLIMARGLCERGFERRALVQVEWELGCLFLRTGRVKEALPLFDACAMKARQTDNYDLYVRSACEKARLLQTICQSEAAIALLDETKTFVLQEGEVRGRLWSARFLVLVQVALAQAYREIGEWEQALLEALQAEQLAEHEGSDTEQVEVCQLLATLYKTNRDFRKAHEYQLRANEGLQSRIRQIGWLL